MDEILPPLERSATEPYDIQYVGRHPKTHFGKQPVIAVDILPEAERRNAQIFNRMIGHGWINLNPEIPHERIALEILLLRCLAFQMTQNQYLRVSNLGNTSSATLKRIEGGEPVRLPTWETLLTEWPLIAKRIGTVEVERETERVRELVSTLLVSNEPRSVNRLLLRLALKHGRDTVDMKWESFNARMNNGLQGNVVENYRRIHDIAALEEKESNRKTADGMPKDPYLWDHTYMKEFRSLHMSETMRQLQSRGRLHGHREKLMEYLKILCLPMLNSMSVIEYTANLGVAKRGAEHLSRNIFLDLQTVRQIVGALEAEHCVPHAVTEELLALWESALEEDENVKPVGESFYDQLREKGYTDTMITDIFDVTGDSRKPITREAIRNSNIMDVRVPSFAVSALRRSNEKDVHDDMGSLYSEIRKRPYHRGKPFTLVYRLMTQFGLKTEDLLPEFHNIEISRYEDATLPEPSYGLLSAIRTAGKERTKAFLRRSIAMFQPETVRDAALYLPSKEKERTDIARRTHTAPHRIHRWANGTEVPPLPRLQEFVQAGNARWTDELEMDWHFRRAESQPKISALGRAVDVVIGHYGLQGQQVYASHNPDEANAPISANLFRRSVTDIYQKRKVDSQQFNRFLAGAHIAHDSDTGIFLGILHSTGSVHRALTAFCKRMQQLHRPEMIESLIMLKHWVDCEKYQEVHTLMAKNSWLLECARNNEDWPNVDPASRPLQKLISIQRLLPGLREEDLHTWETPLAIEIPVDKTMPSWMTRDAWTLDTELSAMEQCNLRGIDPKKPTAHPPGSGMKALIVSARIELRMPTYVTGDNEKAIHPDGSRELSPEEEFDDDRWESDVESSFVRKQGHKTHASKEKTLLQRIEDLLKM